MFDRRFWRELGVMYFSATVNRGEHFLFTSPIREFTLDTPSVPLVILGKFRGECHFRDPVEWPALPTKTEGGIAFPGLHRLTALEDQSVYACVCQLPAHLTEVTPDMFKLDHVHLESGARAFPASEGYKAVIVMSGGARSAGATFGPGSKIDVPVGGSVQVEVDAPAHLVGYRQVVV